MATATSTSTSTSKNYWPDSKCAKAFWRQHELKPYRELLEHTLAWVEPKADEAWLDLGCGSGQLTKAIWSATQGSVREIVGLDCAAVNDEAYAKIRASAEPRPSPEQIRFIHADFSAGLRNFADGHFSGIVSGLAIQYAEAFDEASQTWTDAAYDQILQEAYRVLRAGGRLVFSVNVPEPRWGTVAWQALRSTWEASRPLHFLKRAWRIWSYGGWLKREARRGRFHYLDVDTITKKLQSVGFTRIEQRTSFAEQAYLFRAWKD